MVKEIKLSAYFPVLEVKRQEIILNIMKRFRLNIKRVISLIK